MRFALLPTLFLSGLGVCQAQSPTTPAPANEATADARTEANSKRANGVEQRIERIHLEDAGSRIDELRVGGETQSIDVQPKGGMPPYQIQPASGERSWKILGF
jgi:hypothetical protein